MWAVRANLRTLVTTMLLGQLVGYASLPAALCCAPEAPPAALHVANHGGADEPCCPGMSPGQICPMHRAKPRQTNDGPRIRCATDSAAALPLVGLVGILSAPAAAGLADVPSSVVRLTSSSALDVDITPLSPPPRIS